MPAHFASSAFVNAENSAGELPTGSAPSFSNWARTSGWRTMAAISLDSFCTMAAGVFIVVVATIAVMKAQRQALHGHVELSFLREELPTNLGYRPGMIGENYQNAGMPRAGETPEEGSTAHLNAGSEQAEISAAMARASGRSIPGRLH